MSSPIDGAIPHELRGSIWLLLLGLRAEDLLAEDLHLFAKSARNAVSDDNSKEQIQKDVERTRPGLQRFKQRTVRGALLRLLSLFCARRQVAYVQGFNELLAPFILLADTGGNPRIVYSLFNDFLSRFAPWMLDTSESRVFDVLKRAFKYFERLLLYHDPQLFWLLENNMMSPDLYATSWFVTLFARNFTVECVMALWDLLLLSDNPLGITFFGIAMLTKRREELLSVDTSRLPETLMMLTAKSGDEVRELWRIGSDMQNINTPPSFLRLMNERLLNQSNTPRDNAVSAARAMQMSVCLQTTPDDLVSGDAHFSAWDCRTEAEFHAGHLAQADWLPLDELRACSERGFELSEVAHDELHRAVNFCQEQEGHVCLVGSGVHEEDDADINILARHLTKLGVPYVSTLRGGFKAALAVAQSGSALTSVELVRFDDERHKQARNIRLNAAAMARQEPYVPSKRLDSPPPDINELGAPSPSSTASTPPAVVAMSADSTPKLFSDHVKSPAKIAETGRAVPRLDVASLNNTSPVRRRPHIAPTAPPLPAYISPSASENFNSLDSPENEPVKWTAPDSASVNGAGGIPSLSGLGESPVSASTGDPNLISPNPGVILKEEASSTRSSKSSWRGSSKPVVKNPWGQTAKAKWLDDESLTYPLELVPKGFTVDVLKEEVMAGLRLFPCRAKAERGKGLRGGRNADFRRRYVGVSRNYFLLLAPHGSSNNLLEVKIIRYLRHIVRIAFKRQRPELVTFELRSDSKSEGHNEQIVCVMPDGLKECVKLVKEYLLPFISAENELDLEGTPRSTVSSEGTPRSGVSVPTPVARVEEEKSTTLPAEGGEKTDSVTPTSVITEEKKEREEEVKKMDKKKIHLNLSGIEGGVDESASIMTPTVSASKFFSSYDAEEKAERSKSSPKAKEVNEKVAPEGAVLETKEEREGTVEAKEGVEVTIESKENENGTV